MDDIYREDEEASRLLVRLADLGIYPKAIEVDKQTVALFDRSGTFRIRVEVLEAGIAAALDNFDRKLLLMDRSFSGKIHALCRWGGRPERKGS